MVKTDLIQELMQKGRTGLSSKYSMDKWGFIAQEQGVGQWMGNYYEETSGVRGFWLNSLHGTLAEGRPG